eukprot:Nitzschia sp. Nitz4//scaffold38_size140716//61444//61992//NITZ4_003142-RA/size140716-snap-gene-0.162-mRNA-1//-1//CDS//3329550063//2023//frame0
MRRSSRLSKKRRLSDDDEEGSKKCYRPEATAPMWLQDCGILPTKGDLYGGAHYIDSSTATITPQGRAIKQAAIDFGNGQTLPFTPCKKGYIPVVNNARRVACPLHNEAREKRLAREKWVFRKGEVNLNRFWKASKCDAVKSEPEAVSKDHEEDVKPTE